MKSFCRKNIGANALIKCWWNGLQVSISPTSCELLQCAKVKRVAVMSLNLRFVLLRKEDNFEWEYFEKNDNFENGYFEFLFEITILKILLVTCFLPSYTVNKHLLSYFLSGCNLEEKLLFKCGWNWIQIRRPYFKTTALSIFSTFWLSTSGSSILLFIVKKARPFYIRVSLILVFLWEFVECKLIFCHHFSHLTSHINLKRESILPKFEFFVFADFHC